MPELLIKKPTDAGGYSLKPPALAEVVPNARLQEPKPIPTGDLKTLSSDTVDELYEVAKRYIVYCWWPTIS